MKAKYTVHYEHNGHEKHLSTHSGKTSGGVLFLFHKFMQNVKGVSKDDYCVTSIQRGEKFKGGWSEDAKELRITPDVSKCNGTSTKFE